MQRCFYRLGMKAFFQLARCGGTIMEKSGWGKFRRSRRARLSRPVYDKAASFLRPQLISPGPWLKTIPSPTRSPGYWLIGSLLERSNRVRHCGRITWPRNSAPPGETIRIVEGPDPSPLLDDPTAHCRSESVIERDRKATDDVGRLLRLSPDRLKAELATSAANSWI